MENISIPYYVIYASDYIVFRGKLKPDEIIEVLDAISDICLFGETNFKTDNFFQQKFFEKLSSGLKKNMRKYITSIENGKKGGRPKGTRRVDKDNEDWKEMLEFFDYTCVCCGAKMSEENPPTKDHIIPKILGGEDRIENYQPLCRECNASKGASHQTDYRLNYNIPYDLQEKWGIKKTYQKPTGYEIKTYQIPNKNLNETNIKENKRKEKNIIEDNKIKDKKIDILFDPLLDKCFSIYSEICVDLPKLRFEKRSKEIRELLSNYLFETESDLEYFKDVCAKANKLKVLCDNKLDFKGIIKNHIAIANGKFQKDDSSNVISKLKFN